MYIYYILVYILACIIYREIEGERDYRVVSISPGVKIPRKCLLQTGPIFIKKGVNPGKKTECGLGSSVVVLRPVQSRPAPARVDAVRVRPSRVRRRAT